MTKTKLNWLVVSGLTLAMFLLDPAYLVAQRPSVANINARLNALETNVTALQGQVATLEGQVTTLQTQNAGLQSRVGSLESKLVYVNLFPGPINGLDGPHLIIEGCNVHVRDGSGTTELDGGPADGHGNLVIGYNEDATADDIRTGSHNLVIGGEHTFTKNSGIVAGEDNSIVGELACAVGGNLNTASGNGSFIGGG